MRAELLWGDMPAEYRRAVEPLIRRHGGKLPLWVATLSVRFSRDTEDGQAVAFMCVDYEYRQARITLTPVFLLDTPANRERTVIHEFLHAAQAPVRTFVADVLATYVEDDDVRKLLFSQYHRLEEGCVQDATFAFKPPKVQV
jgi:hypothetical protein